jgi:hypothetical protein
VVAAVVVAAVVLTKAGVEWTFIAAMVVVEDTLISMELLSTAAM